MKTALLTAAAIGALITSPAVAQTAPPAQPAAPAATDQDDSTLGDIVITAQRRTERLQDVPIAVSVFSGEQLSARGITSSLDLGQFVPNLTAQNNTGLGSANSYYLRGLGSTETIPTFDPPVGTYVDEIYLSRQNANNLSLFDVDRVEVLRGPQGTLFGRNTTGGAINVIMRQPEFDKISGYAEAGYGSYNKKLVRGSIDVPLAPTFAIKLSGYWQNDDGYVKDTTTGERLNDDDGWGVRLGLRGELSSSVKWTASYTHIVADGEYILNFQCDPKNPSNCDGRFATTGLLQNSATPPLAGVFTGRKSNFPLGNKTDTDLVTSKFEIGLGKSTSLSLITGYLNQGQRYVLDFFDGRSSPSLAAPTPAVLGLARGGFTFAADQRSSQFTQEIKLNGSIGNKTIEYVAGAYYITESVRDDYGDYFGTLGLVLADRILRNSTEAWAGYAQADVNIGRLKLTAGIRYTDEIKRIDMHDNRASCQVSPLPLTCLDSANFFVPANGTTVLANVPIPRRLETKLWTPRFAINYKPTDDILLFASATRGFKSGGWNARETAPSRILPFDPEKVWSYEIGAKTEFLDHKLRVNVTGFQIDVTDLQVLSGILNTATGALSFITRNPANYRNKGLELEVTAVPARGLNLFANVGYSDDAYRLKTNVPAFDIYGIQSIVSQQAACKQALAAGKVPTGTNTPATQPSITACANSIVTAQGNIASPVRTPDWTISLGASYRAEFGGGLALTPSVNASYHSKQEVATSNLSIYSGTITGTNGTFPANPNSGTFITGSLSPAAWLVNASLTLSGGKAWSLAVSCNNCFDEAFIQSALANYSYLNAPRTWMVRARYNF